MFPYDAKLLAAVQSAPQSVAGVLGTLHAIDDICIDGDGLKWFNWLYLQVTEAAQARIGTGGFKDPAWLALLDVQFARLYFSALQSWLSGHATPGCWRVLFNSRGQTAVTRIQFALAGINAHINHDLPEAIVNTFRLGGGAPDHNSPHYTDYTALNTTLDNLIESAKHTLNVRLLGEVLPPVSCLEDTLAAWNVAAAREAAWLNAEHLWQLGPVAPGFLDMLDGLSTVIGKTLLVPLP